MDGQKWWENIENIFICVLNMKSLIDLEGEDDKCWEKNDIELNL